MDTVVDRNNTSFIRQVSEVIKKLKGDYDDHLKYHQRIVFEYLLKYPHIRGILVYQEPGAGKTRIPAAISVKILEESPQTRVIFISAKSLHNNFRDNLRDYLRLEKWDDERINQYTEENYNFVSLNASNMLEQIYRVSRPEDLFSPSVKKKKKASATDLSEMDIGEDEVIENIRTEMKKLDAYGNLDNSFVIVDEAHNLFNSIANGSKNAMGLYQMIIEAKNSKIMFLTGSPIVNSPFEAAICFNMLNGYFPKSDMTLFGEDYQDFIENFVDRPQALDLDSGTSGTPQIKNRTKFSDRIMGLVSFYSTRQAETRHLFPREKEIKVEYVPMSHKQYVAYVEARDRELEELRRGFFQGKRRRLQRPQGASSSYRVRSRQISDFYYPSSAITSVKDERGVEHYENHLEKLGPEVFKLKADGLLAHSPKTVQMLHNVAKHLPKGMLDEFRELKLRPTKGGKEKAKAKAKATANANAKANAKATAKESAKKEIGPGIIYSQFVTVGVGAIGRTLEHYGFKEAKSAADVQGKAARFAIISGDVPPDMRSELLDAFNAPENLHGEYIALLLVTATGAEGISTKRVRHAHVFEPYWHWSRILQFLARAVRMGSHMDLPESERTVQPYIYLADHPPRNANSRENLGQVELEDTTDVTLYKKALENQLLIEGFLKVMRESSIDCLAHANTAEERAQCRVCAPTNKLLFIPDIKKDIQAPSTCQPVGEEKVKAKSVVIQKLDPTGATVSHEYMYNVDKEGAVHLFEFSNSLNAYREIFEDHPDYAEIYNKVKKSVGKK